MEFLRALDVQQLMFRTKRCAWTKNWIKCTAIAHDSSNASAYRLLCVSNKYWIKIFFYFKCWNRSSSACVCFADNFFFISSWHIFPLHLLILLLLFVSCHLIFLLLFVVLWMKLAYFIQIFQKDIVVYHWNINGTRQIAGVKERQAICLRCSAHIFQYAQITLTLHFSV